MLLLLKSVPWLDRQIDERIGLLRVDPVQLHRRHIHHCLFLVYSARVGY